MMLELHFHSISCEWKKNFDQTWQYALILMTSGLGLLSVNICQFSTELWTLNDVKISFPLNILSMNKWILTKFCTCIKINNIYIGIVKRPFWSICYRVTALEWSQNFVSAQYLENEKGFCTCININNIWLSIVKSPFSSIRYKVTAFQWCQNFISSQYLGHE